ncbi:hypothetical protein CcCBS67573_g00081 [Chytriomyces confervae]|uniref:Uncharacterized protein n=1 Tax=Chytriomyces confervae TaxID=246404 RepID=A0A507FR27_9FUNG|nr:hypothetical protein CcCBS67573_g00081 [Chytriomyces confervae]
MATKEVARRIALAVGGIVAGLFALRDAWHIVAVGLFGMVVERQKLYLRWRLKTFHVEKRAVESVFSLTPWALMLVGSMMLVAMSARRRGFVRYALVACAGLVLVRWVVQDCSAIYDAAATFNHVTDSPHAFEYATHHAEAILPGALAQFADMILARINEARLIADAENATDHDWLHSLKGINYPIAFMPPDFVVAFPWSFVFLFLCGLGASALTHRYSLHFANSGRIRFVKRYPDPEETETSDNWDTLVDNPELDPAALSLAQQFDAKMETVRLLGKGADSFDLPMHNKQLQPQQLQQQPETMSMLNVPKAETPISLFPIKDPNESQIEIGNQLRQRRDFQRVVTRNIFLMIFGIMLFLDVTSMYTTYAMKNRIAKGLMKNPNVILIVDLGMVPDQYTSPEEFLPPAVGKAAIDDAKKDAAIGDAKKDVADAQTPSKENGLDESITFKNSKHPTPHQRFPQRPPPKTRAWIPEYPFPATPILLILFLIKLAVPPLFAPRVRLRLYKDKLVAIPLTYPVQYHTLHFKDVTAIEIKGEETPSGTLYLRHRKYVKLDRLDRHRAFKSIRGYLYSGLGDLGRSSPEDFYLVMLRTRKDVEEWGVQVQGMSVDRLRDVLDAAILKYHAEHPQQ